MFIHVQVSCSVLSFCTHVYIFLSLYNLFVYYFLSLEAVYVCIFLNQVTLHFFIFLSLVAVTCLCTYLSIFLSFGLSMSKCFVVLCESGHWVCGESWPVIKDLQPTAPVLKAGHLVSCSCVCCVCCLLVWVGILGFFLGFFLLPLASVLCTCISMYIVINFLKMHAYIWCA